MLLVEDSETDVYVISSVLERCGWNFDVHVEEDGERALAYLRACSGRSNCPALVLLDLNLPKVGGIEVLKALREETACRWSAVIVVSSSNRPADREAARRLGADAYFNKPHDLGTYMELSKLIEQVLRDRARGGS